MADVNLGHMYVSEEDEMAAAIAASLGSSGSHKKEVGLGTDPEVIVLSDEEDEEGVKSEGAQPDSGTSTKRGRHRDDGDIYGSNLLCDNDATGDAVIAILDDSEEEEVVPAGSCERMEMDNESVAPSSMHSDKKALSPSRRSAGGGVQNKKYSGKQGECTSEVSVTSHTANCSARHTFVSERVIKVGEFKGKTEVDLDDLLNF